MVDLQCLNSPTFMLQVKTDQHLNLEKSNLSNKQAIDYPIKTNPPLWPYQAQIIPVSAVCMLVPKLLMESWQFHKDSCRVVDVMLWGSLQVHLAQRLIHSPSTRKVFNYSFKRDLNLKFEALLESSTFLLLSWTATAFINFSINIYHYYIVAAPYLNLFCSVSVLTLNV